MQRTTFRSISVFALAAALAWAILPPPDDWGFFGHRRLNRLAVFTLPPEMMVFFRHNIEYLTEHAVDPDKRRYATRHEAVRHYIDIDEWGVYPFDDLPRDWAEALLLKAEIQFISGPDTVSMFTDTLTRAERGRGSVLLSVPATGKRYGLQLPAYRQFWYRNIIPQYYEDFWTLPCDSLAALLGELPAPCDEVRILDHFSQHGVLPYYLPQHQRRLTEAFRRRDARAILRLAAELGHYIGDAHVPLHTTTNYNGQLTNQTGIHAFWESRIPELFADTEYDYFVGKAEYVRELNPYFWDIVLQSHLLVDSVLSIEKRLSLNFSQDNMFCFDDRLGLTVRTQCRDYAQAYQQAMRGMVEDRWRATILAIGSCWLTAWIDAGQPDLSALVPGALSVEELREIQQLETDVQQGRQQGRPHENR